MNSVLTKKQSKTYGPIQYREKGVNYSISAVVRYDDESGNGHNSFSITGTIDEIIDGRRRDYMGGCIHEEIIKHFPELAHFIKWHLTSADGPMHYLANTIYNASNRDYNGLLAGEPSKNPVHREQSVKFNDVPITHNLNAKFAEFLKSRAGSGEFKVCAIAYEGKSDYNFAPKYTFTGYGEKWHDCPFDTQAEAQKFADAMNSCKFEFISSPSLFGKGKERDLNAARNCAVWPEATDEQLTSDNLKELLIARLPALLAAFKNDVESLGFTY